MFKNKFYNSLLIYTFIFKVSLFASSTISYETTSDFVYSTKSEKSDNYVYNFHILPAKTENTHYEKIITELVYMQAFAVATIGVIAVMPESVSQWSSEDKTFVNTQDLLQKHTDNISKGPVWDNDTWQINYIGHSVAGSYFYVWGRQSGLTWQESAILTTLMSTFYWEYGWEAFAEVPSIQDLIVTPVLGSLLGEYTNHLYNQVIENDGKIYNSIILGTIGRTLLNPIGEINAYLDKAFDSANIEISVEYDYNQNQHSYRSQQSLNQRGMIQSYFKFNFTLKY